jgi:hypothetical protein
MKNIYLRTFFLLILFFLNGCGGGGGGGGSVAGTNNTVTANCPNGTTKTAATQDAANLLCDAPKLLTISPANNANDVSADTFSGVTVTTDSTLDPKSLTADNIKLSASGVNVVGAVTSVGTNGFKFTPSAKLNYVQAYAFTVSVKDTLGKIFTTTINFQTAPNALFANSPTLLPDLRTKYDMLCGSEVMVQNAIAVDLNNDGKKDLVFNLWCKGANESKGSTANTIVAVVQLSDGTFSDKTKEIFGSDIVDLGGVGVNFITTDLNNDAYDDIVIACSLEGMIYTQPQACPMVSFISDGQGHYTKSTFGMLEGDHVRLITGPNQIRDPNGKKQILFIPASGSAEVWQYENGWTKITSYEWLQKNEVIIGSTLVNKYDNGTKLEIWNLINEIWSRITEYPYLSKQSITVVQRVGAPYTGNLFTIDNNEYLDMGGLYEGCSLKRTNNGPLEVIYNFLGRLIPGRYTGQTVTSGYYTPHTPTNYNSEQPTLKLISLGVTEQSKSFNPVTLATTDLDANFYHMECGDFNGDGSDDIFIRTTGTPILYINDGKGNFRKVKSNLMPAAIRGASHIYVDIDGDGVKDVLFFPIDRWQFAWRETNTYTKVQFQLYKGAKAINKDDLIFDN